MHTNHASFSSISAANRCDGSRGRSSDWNDLSVDEDQDAGRECQDAHHDNRDSDCMEEHRDADEDEINREQEQAKIFLDVHVVRVLLRDDVDL